MTVLISDVPYSSYGLSKLATKIGPFFRKWTMDPKQFADLNPPYCSTTEQLLNAFFCFDNQCSLLKLWPLKVSYENSPFFRKWTMDPKQFADLNPPYCSTTEQLLNAFFCFDNQCSLLKLWPLKVSYENRPILEKTPTYSPR